MEEDEHFILDIEKDNNLNVEEMCNILNYLPSIPHLTSPSRTRTCSPAVTVSTQNCLGKISKNSIMINQRSSPRNNIQNSTQQQHI